MAFLKEKYKSNISPHIETELEWPKSQGSVPLSLGGEQKDLMPLCENADWMMEVKMLFIVRSWLAWHLYSALPTSPVLGKSSVGLSSPQASVGCNKWCFQAENVLIVTLRSFCLKELAMEEEWHPRGFCLPSYVKYLWHGGQGTVKAPWGFNATFSWLLSFRQEMYMGVSSPPPPS